MKFATIEVGSNGVRYELVEFESRGITTLDVQTRRSDLTHIISQDINNIDIGMRRIISEINRFSEKAKKSGASNIKCFGTEACRKLKIKVPDFWRINGVNLQVFSEEQEAYFAFLSATSSLPKLDDKKQIAVIDVGNGSTDLIYGKISDAKPKSISLPCGASLLAKSYKTQPESIPLIVNNVYKWMHEKGHDINLSNYEVILMGGLITKIVWLDYRDTLRDRYRSSEINGYRGSIKIISNIYKQIQKNIDNHGFEAAKVFIDYVENEDWKILQVLSGCSYFTELGKLFKFSEFQVSSAGLRQGVIEEEFKKWRK